MINMIETTIAIIRAPNHAIPVISWLWYTMQLKVFFFFIVGKTIMLMFKIFGKILLWDTSAISWLDHVNHWLLKICTHSWLIGSCDGEAYRFVDWIIWWWILLKNDSTRVNDVTADDYFFSGFDKTAGADKKQRATDSKA